MLYLTSAMISSVDLAHYGVSHAKDWISVDCGTIVHMLTNLNSIISRKSHRSLQPGARQFYYGR